MRNDFQVETREISENDLDNISGGLASAAVSANGIGAAVRVGDVLGTVEGLVPLQQVTGLVSTVTGLASVQTAGLGL